MDHVPAQQVNKPTTIQKPSAKSKSGFNMSAGLALLLIGIYSLLLLASTMLAFNSKQGRIDELEKQVAAQKAGDESDLIEKSKYQAVFLSTGQVYFGKIKSYNADHIKLSNIYYLQNGGKDIQASAAGDTTGVSLVKLGCEIHGPKDEMVINREHVTFWENLTADGQVAEAIKVFQRNNPGGQECE